MSDVTFYVEDGEFKMRLEPASIRVRVEEFLRDNGWETDGKLWWLYNGRPDAGVGLPLGEALDVQLARDAKEGKE